METLKEYYYTYYSYEEWGRGYIGSRKCYCLPEEDIHYLGSFKDKNFKPTNKIIIRSDYKNREEALLDESKLQKYFKVVDNPHFVNKVYQSSQNLYKNSKKGQQGFTQKYPNLGITERMRIPTISLSHIENLLEKYNRICERKGEDFLYKIHEAIEDRLDDIE